MKTDYNDLKGKEFTYIDQYGSSTTAILVGAEYHKGITAVKSDNPSKFLICLSREIHVGPGWYTKAEYRKLFQFMIKSIKDGTYDKRKRIEVIEPPHVLHGRVSGQNCAFQ